MSKKFWRRLIVWALLAVAVVLIVIGLQPEPLPVETTSVMRGPLEVTIDEEGQARARDRFSIATPISGRLARIGLRAGDRVKRGETVARIYPQPLDPRTLEESRARLATAEAFQREAQQQVVRTRIAWEQTKRDLARSAKLAATGDIPGQTHERFESAEREAAKAVDAAEARADAATGEVRRARAELLAAEDGAATGAARVTPVRSPTSGRVIEVLENSERVVAAGTPLLMLTDLSAPGKLEVVVDVLSTDAVRIRPGAPMHLERWGGDQPLRAVVRLVEPYAFTKVSALGVEEQRVNVRGDFLDDPGPLGDGYRVEARIQVWYEDSVLKVPLSALVRQGNQWSVFTVESGVAQRKQVAVGERNGQEAQITEGLAEGDTVILHPPNDLEPGVQVLVQKE